MARLVGALTPTMNQTYRCFAQRLDEVAAVIVVMIGESLASAGFNGGRFLLQVPYVELQVRRDAVVYALRNLVGATQEAYDTQHWPRGLDAYRQLFDRLEKLGYGDLRALLVEKLVRTMDVLIERAQQGSAAGLRATGATAQLDLQKFYRLSMVGQTAVRPKSPPLTTFLEALLLFAMAFDGAGGARLLRIARPPILFYGLYGNRSPVPADKRLIRLVTARGALADALDCFLGCGCTPAAIRWQIAFDMVLYHLDRAIDLYLLGKADFDEPERRAAAYIAVIERFGFHPVNHSFATGDDYAADILGLDPAIQPALVPIMRRILDAREELDPLCGSDSGSVLFDEIKIYYIAAKKLHATHQDWPDVEKKYSKTDTAYNDQTRRVGGVARQAGQYAQRAQQIAGGAAQARSPMGHLMQLLGQHLNQGMDEADALEELADLYAEEGYDEFLPAIAGLAARTALRPVLRRAAGAIGRGTARQAVRAASGAVRQLVARRGAPAARVMPRIARSVARVAARRRLPPRAATAALQRATRRIAAQPRLAQRLARPGTLRASPTAGGIGRRFIIRGPVEIRIIGR